MNPVMDDFVHQLQVFADPFLLRGVSFMWQPPYGYTSSVKESVKMSIGYFQWTKIGCFRWTRSGCFRRTLTMTQR